MTWGGAQWVVRTCGYWPPGVSYACAKSYARTLWF